MTQKRTQSPENCSIDCAKRKRTLVGVPFEYIGVSIAFWYILYHSSKLYRCKRACPASKKKLAGWFFSQLPFIISSLEKRDSLLLHALFEMGRPKRNVLAAAAESTTPPDELTEYQQIARVGKPEGNNLYSCILPNTKIVIVELAQRFRNTIWIKRGGFVLVDLTPDDERSKANSKVQGEIVNVVRDEKEWRKMPYWYVGLSRDFVWKFC